MGFVRVLLGALASAQVLFGIVALGLSAAAQKKVHDETDDTSGRLSFFIFAAVSSVIVAIVLLAMACLPPSRGSAGASLAISAFMLIVWIIAVPLVATDSSGGDSDDDSGGSNIFSLLSYYCQVDEDGSGYFTYCSIAKVLVAAWAFGMIGLILSLLTLVVAAMGLRTPLPQKAHSMHDGGPASTQHMQQMTGQNEAAYKSAPAQAYQNDPYGPPPAQYGPTPPHYNGTPYQGSTGHSNGSAQFTQYPGIKAAPI